MYFMRGLAIFRGDCLPFIGGSKGMGAYIRPFNLSLSFLADCRGELPIMSPPQESPPPLLADRDVRTLEPDFSPESAVVDQVYLLTFRAALFFFPPPLRFFRGFLRGFPP